MKFKFTFEKLLRQREIQVDLAKKDLSESQMILAQEEQKLNEFRNLKEQSLSRRNELISQGGSWQSEVSQINAYLIGQDLRIAKQNERLNQALKEVEKFREILRNALVEVKIVETLKEKQKAEFIKEVQKMEQKELDEIVSLRFKRT